MRFGWLTPAALRDCAFERLDQALALLDSGADDAWPLAAYASGVAVECAIRAKHKSVSKDINSGHRLIELAAEANYASRLKGDTLARFSADLNQMDRLWDNLLRYCSASSYLQFLNLKAARIDASSGRAKASDLAARVGEAPAMRLFAEETYVVSARLVKYGEQFWKRP